MNINKLIRQRELKKFGRYRLRKYKLTETLFEQLLKSQGYRCAICRGGRPDTLLIDHCHVTKKIRGLLCNSCNLGIAYLKSETTKEGH
jgi:Recombination endonuclease VII